MYKNDVFSRKKLNISKDKIIEKPFTSLDLHEKSDKKLNVDEFRKLFYKTEINQKVF